MSDGSQAYFDALGSGWDELREVFFTSAVRERALAVAGVAPGTLAADLGAGTGYMTEALLAAGARVIAVDASPSMLDALAAKFPPPAEVERRVGAAEALPLADASVESAFANMLLHHVEEPPAVLAEMARIVKPGGALVVTDLDAHDFSFLAREQHDRWMGFAREDVVRWFRAAGLEDVEIDCAGEDCCTTSAAGEAAAISIFVAWGHKPTP